MKSNYGNDKKIGQSCVVCINCPNSKLGNCF